MAFDFCVEMIKQMFSKFPRKSSKLSQYDSNNSNGVSTLTYVDVNSNSNYVAACEALLSLRDTPSSERQALFIRKLNMCSVVFDFAVPTLCSNEKDAKRRVLLELVDYITSVNTKFTEAAMQEMMKMISANLFRALPSLNPRGKLLGYVCDPKDDGPIVEPSWPHLQIVYEFLLRFLSSPEADAKLAKRYVDHSFVVRLLDLFDSEDQREREYLKTILHRIYGKFMVHRPFIRKTISNIFYHFIFETEKHNGIAELLEILGSIINGFALPLKEEHKRFLVRALIPLHKPKHMSLYHQQLSYCITQFVEKDFKLADTVVCGLLKYWPVTNSSKEVMFLSELEEVLEATQGAEFQCCIVPLFRQIGRCINSLHFQVAERALFLWNNDHIRNLIVLNHKLILPIILPSLERNARGHWNPAVQSLTLNVRKIFSDADPSFYNECANKSQEDEIKGRELLERRGLIWKNLEAAAASSQAVSTETAMLVSMLPSSVAIAACSNNSRAVLGR